MGIVNATPDSFSDGGAFATPEDAAAPWRAARRRGRGDSGRRRRVDPARRQRGGGGRGNVPRRSRHRRAASPRRPADFRRHQQSARRRRGHRRRRFDRQRRLGISAGSRNGPRRRRQRRGGGADAQSRDRRSRPGRHRRHPRDFLSRSIDIALAAGVAEERLLVDPGFGFGKTPAQNLQLIRRLRELEALGRPVLLGVSRKSTIGHRDRPEGARRARRRLDRGGPGGRRQRRGDFAGSRCRAACAGVAGLHAIGES